jgi:propionyl-CoA carboxylase alpha chain
VTTGFLPEHFPADNDRRFPPDEVLVGDAAVAAALTGEERRTQGQAFPSGWRNVPTLDQRAEYALGDASFEVGYRRDRDGTWAARVAERHMRVIRHPSPGPDLITLSLADRRVTLRVTSVADGDATAWEVTGPTGHVSLRELPRFRQPAETEVPGATRAPMHGMVFALSVTVGDSVAKGDLLCVFEAMKMEHRLLAPYAGVVTSVQVEIGEQVAHDEILVIIEEQA